MNPQEALSVGSSVLLYLLGIAATALVTKGVMTQDQANALVPEIATVVIGLISVGVVYWKKTQHSPAAVAAAVGSTPAVASAVVATVNSDAVPGVKVVASSSTAPQVTVDPKGNVRPDPTASKP
jgi:hypothetical protein